MSGQPKFKILGTILGISTLFLISSKCYAVTDTVLYPSNSTTVISQAQNRIIQQNLVKKKHQEEMILINAQLQNDPNNTKLLYKKAGTYVDMEQYDKALDTLDYILSLQPLNAEASKLKARIQELAAEIPKNEFGIYGDAAYVSDQHTTWGFSSLHYYRFTEHGTYGARLNYARRYGLNAEQYQLEAYPKFENNLHIEYIYLSFAYANFSQILFPNYQVAIEPYFTLPSNFELSLGFRGLRTLGVKIYDYTGSLGYYWNNNNYAWFRPYHYTPKSSDFFEFGIRHYFNTPNTYISLKVGMGKAPDILDLAPLNQIVVLTQDLIAITGQFPLQKNIYLQVGAGYTHQRFPSGTIRDITDGSLQFLWQF